MIELIVEVFKSFPLDFKLENGFTKMLVKRKNEWNLFLPLKVHD
jgi:hypothetical protein